MHSQEGIKMSWNNDAEDDEILFADESSDETADIKRQPWKILIVDDDEDVHQITKLVLNDYSFEDRTLDFISAYSGKEAKLMLEKHSDIAIVLLDVVMETDESGLEVAHYIREELKNKFVRIILRTGQPGKAPERKIITTYDINEYKEKTELTAEKLFTTVTSSLRTYRDLRTIEKNRAGLEQIIQSSARLFEIQSLRQFAKGVLTQLLSILRLDESSLYLQVSGFTASQCDQKDFVIIAATGKFENCVDKSLKEAVPEDIMELLNTALVKKKSFFRNDSYIGYFPIKNNSVTLLYLNGCKNLTDIDKDLISIFSTNVTIAFKNIFLNKEIVETQKEVIFTLGEVVETRSKETAHHVRRVAELSYLLALKANLDQNDVDLIKIASPMHDLGKIGIPDSILFKPERLTIEEFEKIKPHSNIGYQMLKNSKRKIIEAAAIIACQHHERWDGSGYPRGLKGENIHIYGRIVGLADVFDALSHKRVYKEAWPIDKVISYIKQQRGILFDPKLTDIFLKNVDEFIGINEKFPD
ncbi:3'3'-cGAMP-specific phosphodiesterase 2 [Candidatus Magnetomoraceae bacterium gMMP-13]